MFKAPLVRLFLACLTLASAVPTLALAQTATSPTVTSLTLVSAASQKDLRTLSATAPITLSEDGVMLNIRADVSSSVRCVAFYLDGRLVQTENLAPLMLAGDSSGRYNAWIPPLGTHTLRVVPYSGSNRSGTKGSPFDVTLEVAAMPPEPPPAPAPEPEPAPSPTLPPSSYSCAVTQLMLIDAATQKELHTLQSGNLALSSCGSAVNIRADVSGSVKSVAFYFDGKLIRCENVAPYAFAADGGGKFYSWTPPLGKHTVRAVPYSGSNRSGTAGAPIEVALDITQQPVAGSPGPVPTPDPEPTPGSGLTMFKSDGSLDLLTYTTFAKKYDRATMERRLGPSFLDLNPNAPDDRPTLYRPPSYPRSGGYYRTNPYELGGPPKTDGDYWSDSGQVAYIPDDLSDPGLDRIQTYAYYDKVFAISPRLDWASGRPHPDPQTREPYYLTIFGEYPKHPIAMVRSYGMQQNEALVLYRNGYLGVAGMQTSRNGSERPYPGLRFPAHKVPTSLAVTTACEFALVTVWDTNLKKGQLAVIALEAKFIPFHTLAHMAMPNQGSWSAFKLLGYIDLPMTTPTSVAAASNAWWSGPSQTGGLVLGQLNFTNESHRRNLYTGSWTAVFAKGGYAIVASQHEDKVAIVDLSPLFTYVRDSYLSSVASFQAAIAARGPLDENFPEAFTVKPEIAPKVVWTKSIPTPNAVLAGLKLERWTKDYFKAYVASRDGTISIIDTSSLMKRNSWERLGTLRIAGSFNVGANPVDMCFTRRGDSNLPLIPHKDTGVQYPPDTRNNLMYIAVRGERKVVAAVTFEGKGEVYRTIKDKRMGDPVAVSTAIRGPIVSVADFRGKKMISFRVGKIRDSRNDKVYGCGADGNDPFEYAGDVPFAGHPFLLNSANTN